MTDNTRRRLEAVPNAEDMARQAEQDAQKARERGEEVEARSVLLKVIGSLTQTDQISPLERNFLMQEAGQIAVAPDFEKLIEQMSLTEKNRAREKFGQEWSRLNPNEPSPL